MCGRFSLGVDTDRLVAEFGLARVTAPHRPRYNIAPTQPVPAVVLAEDGPRLGALRWGLVPARAPDPGIGARLINARSETVDRRPAFRRPFRRRRCWVLADGFYEWERRPDGRRAPHYFQLPDGAPFAMAGLWDRWTGGGEEILSCAILTTTPAPDVAPIHDRMPVILPPEARRRWLDPATPEGELKALLRPFPGALRSHRVSTLVNSPQNDTEAVTAPIHD